MAALKSLSRNARSPRFLESSISLICWVHSWKDNWINRNSKKLISIRFKKRNMQGPVLQANNLISSFIISIVCHNQQLMDSCEIHPWTSLTHWGKRALRCWWSFLMLWNSKHDIRWNLQIKNNGLYVFNKKPCSIEFLKPQPLVIFWA